MRAAHRLQRCSTWGQSASSLFRFPSGQPTRLSAQPLPASPTLHLCKTQPDQGQSPDRLYPLLATTTHTSRSFLPPPPSQHTHPIIDADVLLVPRPTQLSSIPRPASALSGSPIIVDLDDTDFIHRLSPGLTSCFGKLHTDSSPNQTVSRPSTLAPPLCISAAVTVTVAWLQLLLLHALDLASGT